MIAVGGESKLEWKYPLRLSVEMEYIAVRVELCPLRCPLT